MALLKGANTQGGYKRYTKSFSNEQILKTMPNDVTSTKLTYHDI